MRHERFQLGRLERAQYFAPVAFCAWIALLCLTLMVTAQFLVHLPDAAAVTAAGLFGFILCSLLGVAILSVQWRALQYRPLATASDAAINFERLTHRARDYDWHIESAEPGRCLVARSAATELHRGDIIAVRFRGREVLIASVSDPAVGFSLAGYRRCAEHRARVCTALLATDTDP